MSAASANLAHARACPCRALRWGLLVALVALSGCTVLSVTATVASTTVGVTTTAVGVAADVAVAAGKGVAKAGSAVYDAARGPREAVLAVPTE
ncbi:hypothetical protein [Pseudogulbenkiania subflava]|uniref:hypothetical protein n=1 Tax=Pseudogulbenkiania subflava TaxID=451637 RepID=UPI0011798B15|nr:hypothetical protein [Pseudogulbenkiania subflava]